MDFANAFRMSQSMTGEMDSTSEKPFTLKDLDEWIMRLGRNSPTMNDMMRFSMLSMKVDAIFKDE